MMLNPNMPYLEDKEGDMTPDGLPAIIDTHVHVFPDNIFSAIWKWFDKNAWHIRYQMTSAQIIEFLVRRGLQHVVALQYSHKPGIARYLNTYMAELCRKYDQRVTGMATVFPGEDEGAKILQEAFNNGLGGLKLHAHVQCFDMNDNSMIELYECCQHNQKPIIMHVGREPKSSAYSCDPYQFCSAEKLEIIVKDFPELKICVPHLGFDESESYRMLIEKYDNLWLDTAMVISDYFAFNRLPLNSYRTDRLMYGSDFPNIPFAWDRELKMLDQEALSQKALKMITHENAVEFFGIDIST